MLLEKIQLTDSVGLTKLDCATTSYLADEIWTGLSIIIANIKLTYTKLMLKKNKLENKVCARYSHSVIYNKKLHDVM